jgi:hypothetical protein
MILDSHKGGEEEKSSVKDPRGGDFWSCRGLLVFEKRGVAYDEAVSQGDPIMTRPEEQRGRLLNGC